MDVAALLLTGGSSRRMGWAKSRLLAGPDGEGLAARSARVLAAVAAPCLEVGPGDSPFPAVREEPPGAGPLAAMAAGGTALAAAGWRGPALVVATDLPCLGRAGLAWLAGHPAPGSVVPCDAGGRPQPLCARWSAADLAAAVALVAGGRRAVHDLMAVTAPTVAPPPPALGDGWLRDVDTPAEARRLGVAVPGR